VNDAEVVKMATFKLGEAANRVRQLVGQTRSPALRATLARVHGRLLRQQERLHGLMPYPDAGPSPTDGAPS